MFEERPRAGMRRQSLFLYRTELCPFFPWINFNGLTLFRTCYPFQLSRHAFLLRCPEGISAQELQYTPQRYVQSGKFYSMTCPTCKLTLVGSCELPFSLHRSDAKAVDQITAIEFQSLARPFNCFPKLLELGNIPNSVPEISARLMFCTSQESVVYTLSFNVRASHLIHACSLK